MNKKRWMSGLALAVVLSLLVGTGTAAVSIQAQTPGVEAPKSLFYGEQAEPFASSAPAEYVTVCANDRYALAFRQDIGAFAVTDTATNTPCWNMAVTQDLYNVEKSTKTWKDYMQSLLSITYASKTDTRGNFIKAYSAAPENTLRVSGYASGLSVTTVFADIGIVVTVEIRLDADGLRLHIPSDGISEDGDYALLSVELLPFFGAATAQEEGYIFYPDGNGALSYFSETQNKHLFTTGLSLDIYGTMEHADMLAAAPAPQVMLPVYGIKKGERAFLAAITEGDADARILVNAAVNMSPVKLNRASFEFIYRHQYRIYLSNIVTNGQNAATNLYGTKLDKERLHEEREVKLFFLQGEAADYSGMACAYRAYLHENGLLGQNNRTAFAGLSLAMLMGVKENSGIVKKIVPATTLPDVSALIQQYTQEGVDNLQLRLRGWSKNGYGVTPDTAVPSGAIGGAGAMKKLQALLQDTPSAQLYLEMDLLNATEGVSGFYSGRDAILQGNSIPVSNDSQSRFLLAPSKVLTNWQKAAKRLTTYPAMGYALQGIGKQLYHDSNSKRTVSRQATQIVWQSLLQEEGRTVSVEGGNLYVLAAANQLYDIPMDSSGSQLTDEDIPWYSMVVYGSVPYSAQPGNQAYDWDELKLKWVEYGCTPYFELTTQSPTVLKDTAYNVLFTSESAKWHDHALAVYQEFSDRLANVQGQAILHHQRLSDDVVKMVYANGTQVWINYGDAPVTIDNITIAAQDYAVAGGENR